MPEPILKTCTKCGESKPHDEYYFRDGKPIAACKDCTKAKVAEYQRANRDKVNEWGRARYARIADRELVRTTAWAKGPGRASRAASKKRYNARNAEARAAYWADYYARKGDEVRAKRGAKYDPDKKRATRNPEQSRLDRERRRARLLNAYVEDTPFDAVLQRDEGICGICDEPIMEATVELDHIIPLAAGGTHEMKNVQIAHRACNRRKWKRSDYAA
jgi:formylmethanofuran dehydrogenase subunit E